MKTIQFELTIAETVALLMMVDRGLEHPRSEAEHFLMNWVGDIADEMHDLVDAARKEMQAEWAAAAAELGEETLDEIEDALAGVDEIDP